MPQVHSAAEQCQKKVNKFILKLSVLEPRNRRIVSEMNEVCYFADPWSDKWSNTVFAFDAESKQVMDSIILKKSMKSKIYSFSSRMVQCLDQLFFARVGSKDVKMFKVDQIRSGKERRLITSYFLEQELFDLDQPQ